MAAVYEPGLHILYDAGCLAENRGEAVKPEIDIVAVHGLNFKNNPNHARATWHSRGALWIRDFLPLKLQMSCRVMLFSYNSSPAMGAAAMRLDGHAKELLRCLVAKRENDPRRPLMFICHSLGGIVVKSALVEATLARSYKSIVKSTRLLVFFATPHQGGNYSSVGEAVATMVRAGLRTPSNDLLDALKAGSHDAMKRFEQSNHLLDRCLIISFYETLDYGKLGIIVDRESAILHLPEDREKQIAMDANHSSICKFPTAVSCEPVLDLIATELDRALELERCIKPKLANSHWLVPRSANPLFTGREEIVDEIVRAMALPRAGGPSKQQNRFILTGLGGQGKSEICLHVANQMMNMFWGVFWVDVSNKTAAAAGFIKVARMLRSGSKEIDEILLLLSNCSTKHNWLLVLDNADDPDMDYQVYFPSSPRGAVLMTSRLQECRLHSTVGFHEVGNLSEDHSIDLLLKVAGVSDGLRSSYRPQAAAVAKQLGYHTLALINAGTFIALGHCSMADYTIEFSRQCEKLLQFGLTQSQSRYRNVFATFEASAQVLELSDKESARDALCVLGLLATFHHEDIPICLFSDVWNGAKRALKNPDDDEALDHLHNWHVAQLPEFLGLYDNTWSEQRLSSAILELCSLALVNRSDVRGEAVLSLHPLAQNWISIRQEETGQQACLQSSSCLFAVWNYSQIEWQPYVDLLGPHISSLLRNSSFIDGAFASRNNIQALFRICDLLLSLRHDQELASLLDQIFQHFNASRDHPTRDLLPLYNILSLHQYNDKSLKECIQTIQDVIAIQRLNLGSEHLETLTSQNELARAYLANGQWNDAILILEDVRAIQEQSLKLAKDHSSRIALIKQLGSAYRINGRVKEGIVLLEEIVEIQKLKCNQANPSLLASQYELAMAYLANSQTDDAVQLFEETDMLQGVHLHDHHPHRLALQTGLARAYLESDKTAKAIELFEHILELESLDLEEGNRNCNRLATQHHLGAAYCSIGRTKDAINMLEEIVEVSYYDAEHPNAIANKFELGAAYLANGQTKDAIALFERLEMAQHSCMNDDHPDQLMVKLELALAYQSNGQASKGIEIIKDVINIQKLTLEETNSNLLASQQRLAQAFLANSQSKDAVDLLEKIVQIKSTLFEEDDPRRLVSEGELARAYLDNGQTKDALFIIQKVEKLERETLDALHPLLLASQHELGRACLEDGQIQRAVEIYENLVQTQQAVFNEAHPSQLISQRGLGSAYIANNQLAKGIAMFEKVVEIERTSLDEDHPSHHTSKHQLSLAYIQDGQISRGIQIIEEILQIQLDTLPESHPLLLASQHLLGSAYLKNRQNQEAIRILEDTVKTRMEVLGEYHPSLLASQHQLGVAYLANGQTEKAMEVFEQIVGIRAKVLDKHHPKLVDSQHELGCCYLSIGRISDAIAIFQQVVQVHSLTLDRDNPIFLNSQQKLGRAYAANGQLGKAVRCLEEVVSMERKMLEPNNTSRISSEHELGVVYLEAGQMKKGIELLEGILKTQKRFLSEDHFLRHNTQYELGSIYLALGQTKKAIPILEDLDRMLRLYLNERHTKRIDVQNQLARARKLNNPVSRAMLRLGLR